MSKFPLFLSFRRLRPFAALSLFVVGASLPGCFNVGDDDDDDDDDDAESCDNDDDCDNDEICNDDDECEPVAANPECENDADCLSDEFCTPAGVCQRDTTPADTRCTSLCTFFTTCSDPVSNCVAGCEVLLDRGDACSFAFDDMIQCIEAYSGVCTAIVDNCQPEIQTAAAVDCG